MPPRPQALIVALGDWYGVCRLPQLLHGAGLEVSLLVLPRGMARRSRFAHALPMEGHGAAHVVAALRAHLQEHPQRYQIIVPGDDMIVRELAAEPDPEWLRPWFPVDPTSPHLNAILSKAVTLELCAASDLPSPKSILCAGMEDAFRVAGEIGYPVFFKGEQSSAGAGVGRAENEEQLRALLRTLAPEYTRSFSIQQALEGRVGSTAVLAWKGEAIQWIGSYKLMTWPYPYGASTQREFMEHADIEIMARTVAQRTGYSGFFGLDWIQDEKTGRCHVIEMNPRPTPQTSLSHRGGVDFADGLRHLFAGGPRPVPGKVSAGVYRMFPQDLFRIYDQRDYPGLARWIWDLLRGRGNVPWSDYSVVIGMLRRLQRHIQRARAVTPDPARSPAR